MADNEGILVPPDVYEEMLELIRRGRTQVTTGPTPQTNFPPEPGQMFQNKDSGEMPPCAIFWADAFHTDHSAGARDWVDAKKMTTEFPKHWFINDFRPVENAKLGRCQKADKGTFRVAYDPADGTPAFGETWGWKPGTWMAKKNYPGLKALGKWGNDEWPTATSHIMLATSEEPQFYLCKPDSNISKGSSGTVSVYNGADPPVDTTINVTAKALFDAVTSGKWCSLTFYGGNARVGKLEC